MTKIKPQTINSNLKLNLPRPLDWRQGIWSVKDDFFENVPQDFRYEGQEFFVVEEGEVKTYVLVGGTSSSHAIKKDKYTPPKIQVVGGEIVVTYPDDTPDEKLLDINSLIDDRVNLKIDAKIANLNVPDDQHIETLITNHIPDINDLTDYVNNKVADLEATQSSQANSIGNLIAFKDNIDADIDARIDTQLSNTITSVEADISNLKDKVEETANLKGAVLTAINAYKGEFKYALDIEEETT